MFASFARRPIAQQLIVATISAFVVVFAVLILVMQQKAEHRHRGTERISSMRPLMAGMLDSTYEAVKIRRERIAVFPQIYGRPARAGTGLVKTGDVDCRSSSWATRC
jgi:hypothetical protein